MPSPSKIGSALYELFADGRIWPHLDATFTAALLGLALGIVVGIVLGVIAALIPPVAELLEPVMTLLNAIPRVVLAPLFVIWLGIELASKVALAFILVAVVIFFTVYGGIRQVDRKLVERIVTLGGIALGPGAPRLSALGRRLGAGQPQGRGRLCLHRRLRRRVRRREPRPRLSPLLCAVDLQLRADVRADLPDHGGGSADLLRRRPARKVPAALAITPA